MSRGRWILIVLSAWGALALAPLAAQRLARFEAHGNELAVASFQTTAAIGIVRDLLVGPVPATGAVRSVLLAPGTGSITFDLGREVSIGGILVQAQPDDRYAITSSLDAVSWEPVWDVPPSGGRDRSHIRQRAFSPRASLRYLRIQSVGESGGVAGLGAVRAYATLPPGWPRPAEAVPGAVASAYPWVTSARALNAARFLAALVASGALLGFLVLRRRGAGEVTLRRAKHAAIAASLVAGMGWWNFWQLTGEDTLLTYENHWDLYHYTLPAKYAPELRYTTLYRCYLAAEAEDGLAGIQTLRAEVRDLETKRMVETTRQLAEPEACKTHFGEARWQEFRRDHAWFRGRIRPIYWMLIPLDHGFAASPAWTIAGRALASAGTLTDATAALWISIDTLLIVLLWAIAWATFGWWATCAAIVYWGTNYLASNAFTLGAYLRHDWLLLTVAGICALRRERMALAGFLLAGATLLRVFPGMVLAGVALAGVAEMIRARRVTISAPHRRLAAGAIAGVLLVGGASFLPSGRASVWSEFAENSAAHQSHAKSHDVGLNAFLRYVGGTQGEAAGAVEEQGEDARAGGPRSGSEQLRAVLRIALPVLFVALLLVAVARQEDWVAAILGLGLVPFAADLSNYYYVVLLVFAFLAVRGEPMAAGFALLTLVAAGLGLVFDHGVQTQIDPLYLWGSAAVLTFLVGGTATFARAGSVQPGAKCN